jgi:hypothetical protein
MFNMDETNSREELTNELEAQRYHLKALEDLRSNKMSGRDTKDFATQLAMESERQHIDGVKDYIKKLERILETK